MLALRERDDLAADDLQHVLPLLTGTIPETYFHVKIATKLAEKSPELRARFLKDLQHKQVVVAQWEKGCSLIERSTVRMTCQCLVTISLTNSVRKRRDETACRRRFTTLAKHGLA